MVHAHTRQIDDTVATIENNDKQGTLDLINELLPNIPDTKNELAKMIADGLEPEHHNEIMDELQLLQSFQNEAGKYRQLAQNGLDTSGTENNILKLLKGEPTGGAAATMNDLNFLEKSQIRAGGSLGALYPTAAHVFKNATDDFSKTRKDKHAFILNSLNEIKNPELKSILKQKGVTDNERGAYYKPQSKLSEHIAKAPEVKQIIKDNLSELKNGKTITEKSGIFKNASLAEMKKFDNHAAFQKFSLYNLKKVNNIVSGFLVDDWGFDGQRTDGSISSQLNNVGLDWQNRGAIERQFYIIQFEIPIDQIEKGKF